MQSVLKYPLQIQEEVQRVQMPVAAQVLTVQMQNGAPMLWALTFEGVPMMERTFRLVGTGWGLPAEQLRYIATVQDGAFVWHFFEVMP